MTCNEARELIGADPESQTSELLAHLNGCAECQAYLADMRALNSRIRRALQLDWSKVPASALSPPASAPVAAAPEEAPGRPVRSEASNVIPLRRRGPPTVPQQRRPRFIAFVASLAAALVVGFTLWLSKPSASLASEIVTHVEGEPASWTKTELVDGEQLDAVLRKSGVRLGAGMQPVVYASACWFRGHFVPHFVVKTADGPVTVMILKNETVTAEQQFSENGYTGMLVPARTGSVALVSRTPMALEKPASDVLAALRSAN